MILISHRGNIDGPNHDLENSPDYIETALSAGYDVEVDVWFEKAKWYLGHDKPEYQVDEKVFSHSQWWCHAKNIEALEGLMKLGARCFWHQEDDVTLTSDGYLWTYPGKQLTSKSICVMPERFKYDDLNCAGICSDYISKYREL